MISRRLRFEILRRDNYTCRYCGASAPDVTLTVDHVIPITLGGGDDPNNLVTACKDCNAGKSSTSPDEHTVADVDAAAMLFAKAMQQVASIRAADRQEMDLLLYEFDEAWSGWAYGPPDDRKQVPRDRDWEKSVETFCSRGFNIDDLSHYIEVAMKSRAAPDETWKYFCGCCWRELSNRVELARRLIEDGKV